MNVLRGIFMLVGIAVVLLGTYLLYFQADLDRWISIGILTAGILLFIGVCIMAFAGGAKTDPQRVQAAAPTTVVQENRPVRRDNQL